MSKQSLLAILQSAAKELGLATAVKLEKPTNSDFGDLSTNLAMLGYGQLKDQYASPRDLASKLIESIKTYDQDKLIKDLSIAGPGFINLLLSDRYFLNNLQANQSASTITPTNLGQGRTAIVEYSSPNIAKPFTVGHMRSTIIGDSIANLLEASGYRVFRDNHLGDWGTQFGKQIVAIKKFGDEQLIANSDRPVEELVALYVKFHQEAEADPTLEDEARAWFTKLEQGDQEARRLWQLCIDWSFREFEQIYQQLGVSFTENNGRGYGESFFEPMLKAIIEELQASGLAKIGKEGAILIFYPEDEFTPLMIAKKDGSTLYATRDLATDQWRKDNPRYQNLDGSPPLVINEVGAEQAFYFQQLYRAEELLGWYAKGQRVHVKHGLYRFKEGKMSTRKGNVIWLQEVLAKAKTKALSFTKDEEIAAAVSIAALKWNDLKRKSELNISFDWEEILNLQGNSGPYMLYSYARAMSILRKAEEMEESAETTSNEASKQPDSNLEELEKNLIAAFGEFKEVVSRSAAEFAPHYLCNYLFDLAQTFNSFYNKHQILKDPQKRQLRLELVRQSAMILNQGLALLGIKTLAQM